VARILLTGSRSYLARHLEPLLEAHEVRGLDLIDGHDVTDPGLWRAQRDFEPEAIIHLAGIRPMQAPRDPELALRVNVLSTALGLDFAAAQHPSPTLVLASSYFATGPGVYGLSKRAAELIGSRYPRFRAARLGSVLSPDKPAGFSDFFRRLGGDADPVEVPIDPDLALPVIHPQDAASALLFLALAPAQRLTRQVYDAFGARLSPRQVISARTLPLQVVYRSEVGADALRGVRVDLSSAPLETDTGWRPIYDGPRLIAELVGAAGDRL